MRTARALTVSPSMLCTGGVGVHGPRGVHGPGGCMVPGGAWSWGVHGPWGCMVLGVHGGGGVVHGPGGVSQHALRQTPPVNRMTNRCKNITLPQTSFAGGKNDIAKNGFRINSIYLLQTSKKTFAFEFDIVQYK